MAHGHENITPRKKGDPALPGAGRPPGSPNKKKAFAQQIAERVLKCGPGGIELTEQQMIERISEVAHKNPSTFNLMMDHFLGKPATTIEASINNELVTRKLIEETEGVSGNDTEDT